MEAIAVGCVPLIYLVCTIFSYRRFLKEGLVINQEEIIASIKRNDIKPILHLVFVLTPLAAIAWGISTTEMTEDFLKLEEHKSKQAHG